LPVCLCAAIVLTMNKPLANKRALVTGGSRGIGAAIVQRLAQDGADVALTYSSSPDRATEVAKAAQAFGVRAIAIQADSASADAVVGAVERTVRDLGSIDILVNNAGVAVFGPFTEIKLADFDRTFAINVRAVFAATQAAAKHMKDGGRIWRPRMQRVHLNGAEPDALRQKESRWASVAPNW